MGLWLPQSIEQGRHVHRRCHCRAETGHGFRAVTSRGQRDSPAPCWAFPTSYWDTRGFPAPSFGNEAVRGGASSRLVSGEANSARKGSNSTPIGDMKCLPSSYVNSRQFLCRNEAQPFLPGKMLGHVCKSHRMERGKGGKLHSAGKRTKR